MNSKSVLGMGALKPGEPPDGPPWWRDSDKLLAAVVRRAQEDRQFALRVAEAVGPLAQHHPGLRKVLHSAAAGAQRGAPGTPRWALAMVAWTYHVAHGEQPRGARARTLEWLVSTWPSITSQNGAAKLLAKALAAFPNAASLR